ncbi:MAG: SAM-dependent methyltransferase [Roseitalea sp.]|jgi:SAM-dependent MidA family methyltransferase|nr:SAM-dependent methyltransferase [Roseitalea sp.]MBO6723128.1 SAM-dependent methyltransferase [Roseitalea sp.]MBO6742434.1 SAM-dependent methyltransferase [Roseitalea sp.]
MTTPLAAILAARIAAAGPMTIADYMAECLLHPEHGYYASREPFGAAGDFITAPEISQLFGEIVGAVLVNAWRQAGRPSPFLLAEAGPGRGTLMADIIRTARIDPGFSEAAKITLIEASARLRDVQRETLGADAHRVTWADTLDELPALPLFLVANEFFDALPFRQFVRTGDGWRERMVGLGEDDALAFVAGAATVPDRDLPPGHATAPDGSIFEVAPAREAAASVIGAHLAAHGGLAVLIDYGHLRTAIGDTFQAMRGHGFTDPLAEPGLADLTSHVDFEALARAAASGGARPLPAMTLGTFLIGGGIIERAGALGAGKDAAAHEALRAAVARLCGDEDGQMGALFKVLALAGKDLDGPVPPFHAG